ncbi:MAG: trypsin-like serine protease [Myxococcales bacterium]|nr:trypsin-like serine protease [Myxococcales bacterium]
MNRLLLALFAIVLIPAGARSARADENDSRREYVVNGNPTDPKDLRGTVALLFAPEVERGDDLPRSTLSSLIECSAVLIAPSVAVTAAHCVEVCGFETCGPGDGDTTECYRCEPEPKPADSLYVAAGLRTLDDAWSAEIRAVRELVVHEGYVPTDRWFLDVGTCEPGDVNDLICEKPGLATDLHDIALLLLQNPVINVNPVHLLHSSDDLAGEIGTAQGYGLRAPREYEGLLDQPQYASLLNEAPTPIEQVTDQEILTGAGMDLSGGCFGDSGGPLYVQRGNDFLAAGFLSRFRLDAEGPYCGSGSIYTFAPGYIDWIYEKAPEAIPFQRGGGGAGCSTSPRAFAPNGIWLAGLLALVLLLRARRGAVVVLATVLLGGASSGCGSDGGDLSDLSFCNDKYDPSGDFCDPSVERIDLGTAEKRARDLMPSEAWLWSAVGGAQGTVNPDGEAEAWFLQYYIPGQLELPDLLLRSVAIGASEEARAFQEIGIFQCVPTEPMVPLDSRVIVHDAIRRLEQAGVSVRLGEERLLRVVQRHRCARQPDEWSGVGVANAFLYYDDDGSYLGMEKTP